MTESLKDCLSTDKLRDYALGRMPEDQWQRVAAHLETCVTCEDTISSLDGTADSMLDHLRMPPSQSIAGTPEYLAAMAKLQNKSGDVAPTSSRVVDSESHGQIDTHSPEVVRDYKLIAILGAGGMGTVYKAIHTKLDRIVALKLLPNRRIGNADAIVRFEREMKAIGKLDHPAIVRATDAGEDNGQHFLAMEFVDGFDVSELVDRHGPLSIADASEIIRQAAVGLQHVHERQLVHRDIKPSNLMVTEDGYVKILDLGLALLADQLEGLGELTTVGQMMGTVDYMAPEQCNDSHDVDIRADIYSLGATLFKMLTGAAPYVTSDRRSPLSRIRALATEDPPRLVDCLPDADAEFCSIVDRMLSRNPDDRFVTPGDVATALEKFTEGHDLKQAIAVAAAAPAPATQPHLAPLQRIQPVISGNTASDENANKPPARSRWVTKALIAIAFVAAAIVFRLETDKGEIVVECNVPNVEVHLLKDGILHDELSLKQGKTSLSVYSGKYEIVIPGEAESIKVSADRFVISRGSRLVAEIHYAKSAANNNTLVTTTKNETIEPTFSGKTFSEWKQQLADRDPMQFRPALSAIGVLGVDQNGDEAGRLIFEAVQSLFRLSSSTAPLSRDADDVTRYIAVQSYRPLLDDPKGLGLLRELLTDGDTTARRYALGVLTCREQKPASSAPGYAAAQRALKKLAPALIAASYDEDVNVRTTAIAETQGFEDLHPEIIDRYVAMIDSDDFGQVYDLSGILFDLAPAHRPLIGKRHLKFYVDNIEGFRARRAEGERNTLIGNCYSGGLDLLTTAIECGVRSPQIDEALFETLNDSRADVNDRAQAAYLLAVRSDKSVELTDVLIELLTSDSPQLEQKCETEGHRFNPEFGPGTQRYLSLRAMLFEALGNVGPGAKAAIPVLNSYLNPKSVLGAENRSVNRAEHETMARAIEAIGKIGMNADSIPALERFLNWPSLKSVQPDLNKLASKTLRLIPPEELQSLRDGAEKASPPQN